MDTSKEYIKMCEKAKEIQNLWKPRTGDVFAHIHPEKLRIVERNPIYEAGVGHTLAEKGDIIPLAINFTNRQSNYIWLPRQDQLQEIVSSNVDKLLDAFSIWEEGTGFIRERDNFTSMEQLWLAFIMEEKYKKIWNGKSWK